MHHDTESIKGFFYDGVLEPRSWHTALDAMCRQLQAGVFHSFTLDPSGAPAPESTGNLESFGLHERHMAEYEMQHAGNDLRMAATLRVAPGGVMLDHEHVSEKEASRNSVYSDWLMPLGLKHTAGTIVRMEGSAFDVISFMRPRDAKPYSVDDKHFIERLIPDISRAARLRVRMGELSLRAHLGLAALDGIAQGITVVDGQCRMHYTNAAAQRWLASQGPLRTRHGCLQCLQGADQVRLAKLVNDACATAGKAGAFVLAGEEPRMVIAVLPLRANHAWASLRESPMALVVATVPGAASSLTSRLMGEILGLSPKEARLVLLLAAGKTVKDFAVMEGCSWHTARTHLRNLMRKTGCHRQAELVQLVRTLQ